jgi:hypothetical protein
MEIAVLSAASTVVGLQAIGADTPRMHEHAAHTITQPKATPEKQTAVSLDMIHGKRLPAIQEAIRTAIQHIEAGHAEAALAELRKVQGSLQVVHQALGRHIGPKFVNSRCPIMGSPINADKVAANLVRDYQGQKVAFCCAGCPAAWDRLSGTEKEVKLKRVSSNTQHEHKLNQH